MMAVKPEVDKDGNVISVPEYQEFVVQGKDFDYWQQQWWLKLEEYYSQVSPQVVDVQLN